jgi:hypothetical protein
LEDQIETRKADIHFLSGNKFFTLVNSTYEELTTITIPNNVTRIKPWEYYGINGPTKIIIPANVTSIGSRAFSSCYSIKEVVIEEGVRTIGSFAFCSISNVNKVYIPSSVQTIGFGAFEGSISPYANIYIGAPNAYTGWDENWLFYNQDIDFYKNIFHWNVPYEEHPNN